MKDKQRASYDGPKISVQNRGEGSFQGNTISDQSGVRTAGDHSPVVAGDLIITYGAAEGGKNTPVELRNSRASWVTSDRAKWLALVATVVSAAMSVWTIWGPVNWRAFASVADIPSFLRALAETWAWGLSLILLTVISIIISVKSWRFFTARSRQWPIYYRRNSWHRALIPSKGKPGSFYRAKPVAECIPCREDNRPGVNAKLFGAKANRDGIIQFRCKNGHTGEFRGRSVFGP